MSFNLFKWLHELIDHLERHPQGEQVAPAVLGAVASAATNVAPAATPKDGQTASLSAYTASGGHVAETAAPAPDHTGFDFGNVPSGNPKRNTLEGGKGYTYTFTVPNPTKLRIVVADDNTMGKPAFDNFTLTIKQNGEVVQNVSQPSNTSASYIETPELHGSYSMDFSVDKTALVSLQCGQG